MRLFNFFRSLKKEPLHVPVSQLLELQAGVWPVLSGKDLLKPHERIVSRIRTLSGVSADYWDTLYQPLLENFAAFVQQTPASEAHHHCNRGGMLTHSLQVMKEALDSRKGKMLPPGAAAEEVNRQQHAWTYAVASAALLHDVGKPCSDQKLRLFNTSGIDTNCYWEPIQGALKTGYYRVEFVRNREYRTHELLPPLLARQLMPEKGLSWLQQDFPNVFKVWLAYLSGQDEIAGLLGQMVTESDMQSVVTDLSGGKPIHSQQIPTAKAKPLSQRLLTGLRFLLDENQLPLNRKGAAGFFDGDSLWLVSKRVLDDLRTHMEKEGQTGIPSRNDRLMDELQQHGILIATANGQAIWNAVIQLGDWKTPFTMLRIAASQLWGDPAQYPKKWEGEIIADPKEQKQESSATTSIETATATKQTATASCPTPPADQTPATAVESTVSIAEADAKIFIDEAKTPESALLETSPWDDDIADLLPPMPTTSTQTPAPVDDNELTEEAGDTAQPPPQAVKKAGNASSNPNTTTAAVVTAVPTTDYAPPPPAGDAGSDDTGQRFLSWLSNGLRTGKHQINTKAARLHVVQEGLLLVSPGIFRDFHQTDWEQAQRQFTKLGLHKRHPNNTNIWQYTVRGQRASSIVRGFLIDEPLGKLGLGYLPSPNRALSLPK